MRTAAKENPLVSVLVLTFNHEAYIAKCINGILMQEVDFPYELIVGTDCSTDHTDEIVAKYHEGYPDIVQPVFREQNMGSRANLTDLIAKARGKYIAMCDGDDEWIDRRKLQSQVDILEAKPNVVLVYTDIDQYYVKTRKRVSNIQKRLRLRTDYPDPTAWFEAIILRDVSIYTTTFCVRANSLRSAWTDIHQVLNHSPMADTPMLMALTKYGTFAHLPQSTVLMNRLPESESRSQSYLKRAEFQLASIAMQLSIAGTYRYASRRFDRMLSRRVLMLLRLYALGRSPELATRMLHRLSGELRLNWQHRLFHRIAISPRASAVYRRIDAAAISMRRAWRRLRYGVESSV